MLLQVFLRKSAILFQQSKYPKTDTSQSKNTYSTKKEEAEPLLFA
ncbi:hypothetical protein HMPREF5505_1356 [Lactobacillus delbrueckii subsp. lactis DSM 20072]|nr:hypothetical protein HMPREF5505_1356 [Lactobacillus delbrueckii subsp. lactis DSM 20072]